MIKKIIFVILGTTIYVIFYLLILILTLFIADILKINPSIFMLFSFIIPFFLVYVFFLKFFPKNEILKLSAITTVISIFFIIGSCAFLITKLSNSPNYW